MLAILLGSVITASCALLAAPIFLSGAQLRRWIIVYSIFVALMLCVTFTHFLGFRSGGSPAFADQKRASLEWVGYYTADTVPLVFTPEGGDTTLKLARLRPEEFLAFKPAAGSPRGRAVVWNVRAQVASQPLRIGKTCVNVPAKNWLASSDEIIFRHKQKSLFYRLTVTDDRASWDRALSIRFDQGVIQPDGRLISDLKAPIEIWSTPVSTDRTLAAMLRAFDRERRPPAAIPPWQFWTHLERLRNPPLVSRLRGSTPLSNFFDHLEVLEEFAKDALWVREAVDDPSSRIGLLLANRDHWYQAFEITRTSGKTTYTLLDPSTTLDITSPDVSAVELGSGGPASRQRFDLPAHWSTDAVYGVVADVVVRNQSRWDLPEWEQPFLIMSSEAGVPLPGYDLDIGMLRRPFYAKGVVTSDGEFVVNDGREPRGTKRGDMTVIRSGERFRLGSGGTGAILAFTVAPSPLPFAGLYCISIIAILSAVMVRLLQRSTFSNGWIESAWHVLLHLLLTLLAVRVVLTYRIAVLPPADASTPIQELFDRSVLRSVAALALTPLVLILTRWLAGTSRIKNLRTTAAKDLGGQSTGITIAAVASVVLVAIWVSAVILGGRREELGPLRVNLTTATLSIITIALAGRAIAGLRTSYRLLVILFWTGVPFVLVIFVVHDHGYLVNASFALVVATLVLLHDRYKRTSARMWLAAGVLVLLIAAAIGFRSRLLIGVLSDSWIERVVARKDSYVYYRVAATPEGRERLLAKIGDPEDFRLDMYHRNAAHHWQMLLYASEGTAHAKPYGSTRLSRAGMSYPTSLADSMFAIHVLPEHGFMAGLLLLLVYTSMTGAIIVGAASLPRTLQTRSFALFGAGAQLAFTSAYMASTNLGMAVFTGQNIPFLSLSSGSDVINGTVLMAVLTFLLYAGVQGTASRVFDGSRWSARIAAAVVAVSILWTAANGMRMREIAGDAGLRESLRLPRTTIEAYRSHLPQASPGAPMVLDGERLLPRGNTLSWLELKLMERFNESPDKYDRDSNFYYLRRTQTGRPQVHINDGYFALASPFRPPRRWNGLIRTAGAPLPTLGVLGTDIRIQPGQTTLAESVSLSSPPALDHDYSTRVRITLTDNGDSPFSITLVDGTARLHATRPLTPKITNWSVRIDGKEPQAGQRLNAGEIIRIDGETRGPRGARPFSHSLVYLGNYEPVLANTRWRNGELQRVVAAGSLQSVVSDIASALDVELTLADDAEAVERRLPKTIHLTVDTPLQGQLDHIVTAAAATIYARNLPNPRKAIAVTIMDAYTGDILALSSWGEASGTDEHLKNLNLRNHATGSTIKPVLLSTVATAYAGSGFDVTQFKVLDRADCANAALRHPHCSVAGIRLEAPAWDCDANKRPWIDTRSFLVESRNYMAGVLGMLGMVSRADDWKSFLAPTPAGLEPTAIYAGHAVTFDLLKAPSAAFTGGDETPRPFPPDAAASLLFTTLPRLFEVTLPRSETDVQLASATQVALKRYLPALAELDVHTNYLADNVLPDRIDLVPDDLQSTRRHLLPFFLGGGREGLWSNVRMTESVARLVTGRRVSARIEQPAKSIAPEEMPQPLGSATWRKRNLLEPMFEAGKSAALLPETGPLIGTAAGLSEVVTAASGGTYAGVFKTGTLDERDSGTMESEMLMFVVGRWSNGTFVADDAIAGYVYLSDSKEKAVSQWQRADVAAPILRAVVEYLQKRAAARRAPIVSAAPGSVQAQDPVATIHRTASRP